jgi:hypothetical protein
MSTRFALALLIVTAIFGAACGETSGVPTPTRTGLDVAATPTPLPTPTPPPIPTSTATPTPAPTPVRFTADEILDFGLRELARVKTLRLEMSGSLGKGDFSIPCQARRRDTASR